MHPLPLADFLTNYSPKSLPSGITPTIGTIFTTITPSLLAISTS